MVKWPEGFDPGGVPEEEIIRGLQDLDLHKRKVDSWDKQSPLTLYAPRTWTRTGTHFQAKVPIAIEAKGHEDDVLELHALVSTGLTISHLPGGILKRWGIDFGTLPRAPDLGPDESEGIEVRWLEGRLLFAGEPFAVGRLPLWDPATGYGVPVVGLSDFFSQYEVTFRWNREGADPDLVIRPKGV